VGKYQDSLEAANLDQEGKKRLVEVKAYMGEERKKYLDVLKHWIQQSQGLLLWLIDKQKSSASTELSGPRSLSASSPWVVQLSRKCTASTNSWVEYLSFLVQSYIGYTSALMDLELKLEDGQGEAKMATKKEDSLQVSEEMDLAPLPLSKSVSLPISRQPHQGLRLSATEASIQLIKSLMALLVNPESELGSQIMP
jgi:hypothetical protein